MLTKANPTTRHGAPLIPLPILHSVASSAAELVSCFILTPAEVLKQNAQMVQRSSSQTTKAFDGGATMTALKRFRKPGQLWTGYTALAARNLPFTAMQFPMFEHFKKSIKEYRQKHGISKGTLTENALVTAVSAGAAGSIAAVITTPIDVVKTRIMLGAGSEEQQSKSPHANTTLGNKSASKSGRPSALTIGRDVLRTEGFKALFSGGALRAVWTALGMGLYLGVYESGRAYLEDRRKIRKESEGEAVA